MSEVRNETVEEVVGHVRELAEKYEFTPDENTVEDAVSDSADQLNIKLSEAEIEVACRSLVP